MPALTPTHATTLVVIDVVGERGGNVLVPHTIMHSMHLQSCHHTFLVVIGDLMHWDGLKVAHL